MEAGSRQDNSLLCGRQGGMCFDVHVYTYTYIFVYIWLTTGSPFFCLLALVFFLSLSGTSAPGQVALHIFRIESYPSQGSSHTLCSCTVYEGWPHPLAFHLYS